MKIGFVGLGRMGMAMAQNLIKSDFTLSVWNRTVEKAQDFAKNNNARYVHSLQELSKDCEVVISMLADDKASEEVYLKDDGLLSASRGATTFIEMGTMSPEHMRELQRRAQMLGKQVLDAPVSGSTKAATEATLMIMLGADAATAQRLAPIFQAMGNKVIVLDKPVHGCIMKLVVNSIIHGLNQTLAEALSIAEGAGIALPQAYDVIENSAAAAPMVHYRKDQYLDDSKQAVSFALSLAKKDMRLITELAARNHVRVPQAELNYEQLQDAEKGGLGQRDMAAIIHHVRKLGE